jgi:uncharacterized protein (DUF427 family)
MPVVVHPNPNRVRVMYQGHVIVDTKDALSVLELGHGPVLYVPRKDTEMGFLGKTAHSTHCSRKGDASYFSISMDGRIAENAVWSYETPIQKVAAIKEHLAFYPNKVEIYELTPAEEALEPMAAHPHGGE